jgi:hypothetical protein
MSDDDGGFCVVCDEWMEPGKVHRCAVLADDTESEAFAGLSDETLDAIHAKVTPEQVLAFRNALTTEDQHVDVVLRTMQREPWWPNHNKVDTQKRRLRTIMAAANAAGYPICSTNAGYKIGTADEVDEGARRARRMADGANVRAAELEQLARRMREDHG